jgi:hypothetical protein
MGAAAIVGNDRISQATLDSQASSLQQDIAQYDPGVPVNTAILPKLVLGQLINFAVRNRTAQDLGVTVNQTDIDQAIQLVYQSDAQNAARNGQAPPKSVQQLITLSAVPLNLKNDFGRYYAIELDFIKSKNGGKLPTGNSAAVQQAVSQFSTTECRAARELNIQVNPQYGQLGFDQNSGQYMVTSGSDTLSAAGGSRPVAVLPYTPAC